VLVTYAYTFLVNTDKRSRYRYFQILTFSTLFYLLQLTDCTNVLFKLQHILITRKLPTKCLIKITERIRASKQKKKSKANASHFVHKLIHKRYRMT